MLLWNSSYYPQRVPSRRVKCRVIMDALIARQTIIVRSLSNALDNFRKIGKDNITYAKARSRLSTLKENWTKCQELHVEILMTAESADKERKYLKDDVFGSMEDIFNEASDYITHFLLKTEPKAATTPSFDASSSQQRDLQQRDLQQQPGSSFILPSIELPVFSGDYREWEGFRDRFKSLVVDNQALSNVRRMHYLCSCLKDTASDCVRTLPVTDANFNIAWDTLKTRYENKRRLIHVHLHAFYSLPNVSTGSADELRALRDHSNIFVQSLKNLERPVEHWDDMLVYSVSQRLDLDSRRAWELKLGDAADYPTFEQLSKFLESRIRALESIIPNPSSNDTRVRKEVRKSPQSVQTYNVTQSSSDNCPLCHGNHFLTHCNAFKSKSSQQRFAVVRQLKRCTNCFSSRHERKDCKNRFGCRICQKRHHTMLHFDEPTASSVASSSELPASTLVEQSSSTTNVSVNVARSTTKVLLATAWVQISSSSGRKQEIRALLDQGSEATLLSEGLAQILRVPRDRVEVKISGIGSAEAGVARHSTRIIIGTCDQGGPSFTTNALILPSLTKYVPNRTTSLSAWAHVSGLKLADPGLENSAPIQLIIGADLYGLILLDGIRKGFAGQPIAQNTVFGWVLSGPISSPQTYPSSIRVHFAHESSSLEHELRRFWEVEEIPQITHLTAEEIKCEDHFKTSHSRTPSGQYVVRLPFKQGPPIEIGESESKARSMLSRIERRFQNKPSLAAEYVKFLRDYETLGHMEIISSNEMQSSNSTPVYLPHQAVIRENSVTTQLRVVFNASSITANGTSLNDHLLVGPKLQTDLPSLILQWRQYQYVYCADIAKMYRQILVDRRDVDFQRILWRSGPDTTISAYRLLTVTYGTASAPFLALRVLQQLAEDDGADFPLAVPILRQNTYVDDCLFGADTLELAKQKRDQLNSLLARGHFLLRKWASNRSELLEDIDPNSHGLACPKSLDNDDSLKILGMFWNPAIDQFQFQVRTDKTIPNTKRSILSTIAKLFDPLGWVTPVVITAKILMQRLWLSKCGWDECISPDLKCAWQKYYTQLPLLNQLSLNRWTGQGSQAAHVELHGFSDASNVAYAAVVYIRLILQSGQITTSILASKSKVAPIKPMSIPRLELSGAVLLSKLMTFIQETMKLSDVPCYCWTDSTIVLAWVSQHPSRWSTFIANRVATIQTRLPRVEWRHVPTDQNPADCSSRGISVNELVNHELWWTGPQWLRENPESWPHSSRSDVDSALLEEKKEITAMPAISHDNWDIATKFSSWNRLLRVTSYVIRFVNRCRRINDPSSFSVSPTALSSNEIKTAKLFWLRYIQLELFAQEISELTSKEILSRRSTIASLSPFLDSEGLLRVGGRLQNSPLPYHTKHPIILKTHPLVLSIVRDAHLRNYHAGNQLTLCTLRHEYWILRSRQIVRSVINQCIACVREKASTPTQLMGNLPGVRVTAGTRAFLHSGVDYAGPFLVRNTPGRGFKTHKTYVAVFVCLMTRAVHLELVNGYTTESFLAAFHRFCSRRGLPNSMYSDNGTTFRGADRELASTFKNALCDPDLLNHIATDRISWHFIPPAAPHFGGLWEAGVKSVKHHLKRVVGAHTLTFEEFTTLLSQIEACLNSRPLAPLSDHIDDYTFLSPGHFLIGSAITTAPAPTMLDLNENRLSRWQLVRQMLESLWRRWSAEYINTLQQRSKWRVAKDEIRPGCLVLIRNELAPPCKWELGRVTDCYPGDDNLIRVVKIKTAKSEFKRPISKICILPVEAPSDSTSAFITADGNGPHPS